MTDPQAPKSEGEMEERNWKADLAVCNVIRSILPDYSAAAPFEAPHTASEEQWLMYFGRLAWDRWPAALQARAALQSENAALRGALEVIRDTKHHGEWCAWEEGEVCRCAQRVARAALQGAPAEEGAD
jgi:hypothetical protein